METFKEQLQHAIKEQLQHAILGNSFDMVHHVLEKMRKLGGKKLKIKPYGLGRTFGYIAESEIRHSSSFGSFSEGTVEFVSFLHMAVFNAIRNNGHALTGRDLTPTKILDHLLHFIREKDMLPKFKDCHMQECSFRLHNLNGWLWKGFSATALDFASVIKIHVYADTVDGKRIADQLDDCVKLLIHHEKKLAETSFSPSLPVSLIKTVTVPSSLFVTFKSLLFSSDFSDVVFDFESSTGSVTEKVYAHKCILASSSPYMKALFAGPWSENQNIAVTVIKSSNSITSIKCLLRFIYTGETDLEAIAANSMECLDLSAQNGCNDLTAACELQAVNIISLKNIVAVTSAAYMHDLKRLKSECIIFIKKHSAKLLLSSSFMRLRTSDLNLWKDLRKALGTVDDDEEEIDKAKEDYQEVSEKHVYSCSSSSTISIDTTSDAVGSSSSSLVNIPLSPIGVQSDAEIEEHLLTSSNKKQQRKRLENEEKVEGEEKEVPPKAKRLG